LIIADIFPPTADIPSHSVFPRRRLFIEAKTFVDDNFAVKTVDPWPIVHQRQVFT